MKLSFAVLLLLALPVYGTDNVLATVGGHLVDVQHGRDIDSSVVLIADGKIIAVGRDGEVAVPHGAKIIDVNGKWLIP